MRLPWNIIAKIPWSTNAHLFMLILSWTVKLRLKLMDFLLLGAQLLALGVSKEYLQGIAHQTTTILSTLQYIWQQQQRRFVQIYFPNINSTHSMHPSDNTVPSRSPIFMVIKISVTLTSEICRFHLLYYWCYKPNLFLKAGNGEWCYVYTNKMGERQFQTWFVS